jgi:hypothetical protein
MRTADLLVRPGEEGRGFFRNSFSILSRRISSSISFTRARSTGLTDCSGSGFPGATY